MYCKNPLTEGSRSLRLEPQLKTSALIRSNFYLHNVCRPLYSPTCRYICMTSGCSGRWHRCCSCRAPLHTRPHLERRREGGGWWLADEAETFLMTATLSCNKIQIFQNVKLHDVLHVPNKYKGTQKNSESEYKSYCEAAKPG